MRVEAAYERMSAEFGRAAGSSNAEPVGGWIVVAGAVVKIRIAGDALARHILRPFAHLQRRECGPAEPELTVELWDRDATGIGTSVKPEEGHSNPHPTSDDGRFTLHFHRHSTLSFDRIGCRITGCFETPAALSLYELGRPLQAPLAVWLNDRGTPLIHAGMVSRGGKGLILAGPAGAGKSTVAIASARQGLDFVSDDMIALEPDPGGAFRGHGIFGSTYLEGDHLERLPYLKPHATPGRDSAEDKELVILSDLWPSRMERSADIAAIVLPEVGLDGASSFRSESRAKALMALAPASRAVNRGLGHQGFKVLVEMTEHIPCYKMTVGRDIDRISSTVEAILEDAVS